MSNWSGRAARKARKEARRQLKAYLANVDTFLKPKPFLFPKRLWRLLAGIFVDLKKIDKPYDKSNQKQIIHSEDNLHS